MTKLFSLFTQKNLIIITIAMVIIWFILGGIIAIFTKNNNSEETKGQYKSSVVKTKVSNGQQKSRVVVVYAVTESAQKIILTPKISSSIKGILVKEGDFIKKDTPIIQLSSEGIRAEYESFKTQYAKIKNEYDVAKLLYKKKLNSKHELRIAKQNYGQALSSLEKKEKRLRDTQILAPFDGVIEDFLVDVGTNLLERDTAIATFFDPTKFDVVGYISADNIKYISIDNNVNIIINNQSYNGKIFYISNTAENQTNSFKIKIQIETDDNIQLKNGLNSVVYIETKSQIAHKIHSSILSLNSKNQLIVKIIQDDIVTSYPVDIIEENEHAMWVTGLPASALIITLGFNEVKDREKISIQNRYLEKQ